MGGENARHQGRVETAAFGCAAIMLVGAASAQAPDNYPNRPIRIIVPYPAGGIVDMVARAVTEQVGRDLKTPIVVEARAGGNSNIGTSAVARSDPDGYTWLVTGPAVLVNPGLYKDAGWDVKDFRCVGPCGLDAGRGGRASLDAGKDHRRIRRICAQPGPASSISAIPAPAPRSTSPRKSCFRPPTSSSPMSATRASRRR